MPDTPREVVSLRAVIMTRSEVASLAATVALGNSHREVTFMVGSTSVKQRPEGQQPHMLHSNACTSLYHIMPVKPNQLAVLGRWPDREVAFTDSNLH